MIFDGYLFVFGGFDGMKRNDLYRAKVENLSVDSGVRNQTITQKPLATNQNINAIGTTDAEDFGNGLPILLFIKLSLLLNNK